MTALNDYRWRDAIAIVAIAGIHLFLLGKYGIYDWKDNDGVGYYQLAQSLREWKTWVSVPDLNSMISVTLLRLPLYSLLIMAAQDIFGRFWVEAIIAAQIGAVIYANFILYRAVTLFSGFWIIGLAAAVLFVLTPISQFERFVLTDAFVLSLFTVVVCHVATIVYESRYLTRSQMWAVGAAFAVLFLLREANPLFAIVLAPLLLAAVMSGQRVRAAIRIYAPMLAIILIVGLWNVYRVGSFVITTGSSFNPVLALYQADKIKPVLDQDTPIDRAIKEEMQSLSMLGLLHLNQRLKKELHVAAPQLSALMMKRYLSAWLHHPTTMASHVGNNWEEARYAFALGAIFDVSLDFRMTYREHAQRIMVWALMVCPVLWVILGFLPSMRRQALIALCLWAFSVSVYLFYGAMYLELRYLFPMFGAALLIIALSFGAIARLSQGLVRSYSGNVAGLYRSYRASRLC